MNSDIVFKTKHEAEEVVRKLNELIEKHEHASFADFKDICGVPSTIEDRKIVWNRNTTFTVYSIAEGYTIFLPLSGVYDEVDEKVNEIVHREAQMTKNDILDKARSIINGERAETYGEAEYSFVVIAKMWSSYLGRTISPCDVANMMILMKVARNSSGVYKDDNWIDICGYAALGGEIQNKDKDNN